MHSLCSSLWVVFFKPRIGNFFAALKVGNKMLSQSLSRKKSAIPVVKELLGLPVDRHMLCVMGSKGISQTLLRKTDHPQPFVFACH